jgi:asparagine synthase (glutamine-hydrolysing)
VRDPAGELRELFQDAVRLRAHGDAATGVSLSGGLDSTSTIATLARLRGAEPGSGAAIHAFSYAEPRFNEARYIQATIAQTGAALHAVEVDPLRLWASLGRVLWFHDEPVHSMNVLVAFDICRMAHAAGVRVLLSGSGADEVLGGYKTFFRKYWNALLLSGRAHRAWAEIGAFCAVHGRDRWLETGRTAERLVKGWLARSEVVRGWRHGRRVHSVPQDTWLDTDFAHAEQGPELERDDVLLEDAMRTAVTAAPLPLYLRIEDRNAAANAVHVRLPFLDHRIAELAFRLPADWKLRGPWNKFVLREAMRGTIPEVVRTRVDKMGFPDAAADWFRGALYEPMQDLLASEAVRTRGIYDVAAIRRDLERHRAGDVDVATRLFNIAQLEAWFSLGRSYCRPDAAVEPDAPSVVMSSMSPSSELPASHQPLAAS